MSVKAGDHTSALVLGGGFYTFTQDQIAKLEKARAAEGELKLNFSEVAEGRQPGSTTTSAR